MKRVLPTVLAMALGIIVLLDFFVKHIYLDAIGATVVDWTVILAAFALIVGILNLMRVHFRRIRIRGRGWAYSIVVIASMWMVLVFGLIDPAGPNSPWVQWIFSSVQYPLQATMFSLLAFFTVTAAYRAFRVQRWDSLLFIGAGLVVVLGTTVWGQWLWSGFADLRAWILTVPALAGARGIILGVALASMVAGLRLLLGIDRPYTE